ncbi:MAG: carboxypeptidase regulatory-like domain-containing protein [Planctomycetota bacterium]|nr:MAG: carboxypeptidase regulatory-like domain-containing protein [Planctomycetota bacterium]
MHRSRGHTGRDRIQDEDGKMRHETLFTRLQAAVAALAAFGMIVPPSLWAADPPPPPAASPAATVDVALRNGRLSAQLLDAQGVAVAKQTVTVFRAGQAVTSTKTDAQGRFVVDAVTPGVYQLATAHGATQLRVWAEGTEPPATGNRVVLIRTAPTARGQIGPPLLGEHGGLFGLRWTTTLLFTATAIAVPVAVAADSDGAPASP